MSKYKGKNGAYLTQALFYEWNNPDAPYTLRDSDTEYWTNTKGKKYKSIPYIYRNSIDEYDAAIRILGSWEHWQFLITCNDWFLNGKKNSQGIQMGLSLKQMREEMQKRDESRAKQVLLERIHEGDVSAAKFLYERVTKKTGAGRPEKKTPSKTNSNVANIYEKIRNSK